MGMGLSCVNTGATQCLETPLCPLAPFLYVSLHVAATQTVQTFNLAAKMVQTVPPKLHTVLARHCGPTAVFGLQI